MTKNSLTIVIPAYNEAPTIRKVVDTVVPICKKYLSDYEIIIVNDCSTDKTELIIDEIARGNPEVRSVHNARNMNRGYNFRKGIELATMEYISMIPGDDDITGETLDRMIEKVGSVDMVLCYHTNQEARHPFRRIVSKLFTAIMNVLFWVSVRYYNGPAAFRTTILRTVPLTTFGFADMAEIVLTFIKRGHSYVEVPMTLKSERKGANWRTFRPKNTWSVFSTVARLWWRIQIRHLS